MNKCSYLIEKAIELPIALIAILIKLPTALVIVLDTIETKHETRAATIVGEIYKNIFIVLSMLVAAPIDIICQLIIEVPKLFIQCFKGTVKEADRKWLGAQQRKNGVFCTNQFSDITQDKNEK